MGRRDAGRGDDGGARQPRQVGQGPLRRLLEFFRLAHHEGARRGEGGRRQPFVSQQIHYTLQAREAEYELVPISLDQGLGILVWSPIAGGLLSGKFRRGKKGPEGSRHFGAPEAREPPIYDDDKLFDIVDVLVEIGKSANARRRASRSPGCLARPGVTSVIIGGRTEEQFADNLAAADLKLSPPRRRSGSTR